MTTAIQEYSATESALSDLANRYKGVVFEVTTTKGMLDARKGRAELRTLRISLEEKRKEIKAPALERCRLIDAEAKRITAELVALESPIDDLIRNEETRKEREKAERERIEAERIAGIQQAIADLNAIVPSMSGKSSADIAERIQALNDYDVTEWAAEFMDAAKNAKVQALAALNQLHAGALAQEAEQRRVKEEREELARLKAAESKRQKEAAEREAADIRARAEADAKARAKIAAEEAAANERIAAQRRVAQAEIDKAAKEARERQEAEDARQKAERDRLAAEARALEDRQRKEREEIEARERSDREAQEMAESEIRGIEQQVIIAQIGRLGVRVGGTIACIEETLAETERWPIDDKHFGIFAGVAQKTKATAITQIKALLSKAQDIAKKQAEQEALEAEQREAQRKADELLDARTMLQTFVERFGHLREFASLVTWVNKYMAQQRRAA
jgi:hypothetical protein